MRIPYGYVKNNEGTIQIDKEQADVVRLIFNSYKSGLSLGKISDLLEQEGIRSPTGNSKWTRAAIDKILSNRKYIPLVGTECYFDIQFEKHSRSNIDEDTNQRKTVRHSSPDMSDGFDLSMR